MPDTILVLRLGLVEYVRAWELQQQLVHELSRALARGRRMLPRLLVLEHPHVLTLGRHASGKNCLVQPGFLEQRGVTLVKSDRGGDITYHGPGQLVLYPILHWRGKVPDYVRGLEEVMLRTIADWGIRGERRPEFPGVFVGSCKIGALGVHFAQGITSHGLALNVNTDLEFFKLIVPCGLKDCGVTSLEKETGRPCPMAAVADAAVRHFGAAFGLEPANDSSEHPARSGLAAPDQKR